MRGWLVTMAAVLSSGQLLAFAPIPAESAKALGKTHASSFATGAVFVNGKYLKPPYVVERWGTGIRINREQVTGQVISWNEFLKTQPNVTITKTVITAERVVKAADAKPAAEEASAAALDELFEDAPKEKEKKSEEVAKSAAPAVTSKPTVTYSLEGAFVPNDASKKLLARINALRTDIDRTLRSGGFICFGDDYSQVSGDSRALADLLEKLPDVQRKAQSERDFRDRVRRAGLVYLNDVLCRDLYRNRIDYRTLQERRTKAKRDTAVQKLLNEVSAPLF